MASVSKVPAAASAAQQVFREHMPTLLRQMAHDLNNHLATMLGQAELALLVNDAARFKLGLENVLASGTGARQLVTDLQRLVIWGEQETEPVVVSSTLQMVSRLTAHRRHSLRVDLECDLGEAPNLDFGAAVLVLGVFGVFQQAIDSYEGDGDLWRVRSENARSGSGWSLVADLPGVRWPPEMRVGVERAQRLGEETDGALGCTLACFGVLQAELGFTNEGFSVAF